MTSADRLSLSSYRVFFHLTDAFGTLAVLTPMTCAFDNSLAQSWRDVRHGLSGIQTQIAWQEATLFEKKERSGLAQCKEVLLFD